MRLEETAEALKRVKTAKLSESKKLNLSSLGITTEDLEMLIPIIAETSVTELYLKSNPFQDIPESIKELKNLTLLSIDPSQLKTLPESIGELTNLTELSVTGKSFAALPESIGKLSNLRELYVYSNSFETLPQSLGDLKSLTRLSIVGNSFKSLPESIEKLTTLTELNVTGSNFTALPKSIEKLTNLTELNVIGNNFTALPESIEKLTNLTILNVTGNIFTALPESIGALEKLEKLTVKGNSLEPLPLSIDRLKNLIELTISGDNFSTLPKSIDRLQKLTKLDISGNRFEHLPQSMGELTNLEELTIRGDNFSSLPKSIDKLQKLTKLDIKGDRFEHLPQSLGELQNLTKLYVTGKSFENIPNSMGNLINLKSLDLSNSAIKEVPETLGGLQTIQGIDLRNNPLSIETMIWLDHTFPPGLVTYNMAAHDQNQTAKVVLQLLYTNPSDCKSILEKIEKCDLEPAAIYYEGASQPQSKPAQEIIKEYLSKVLLHSQYDREFYGPPIKSTLDGILNKEHFSREERANNLAIMTTSMGDCSTPIKEGLAQEAVKLYLTQEGTLSEIDQTVIEKEALKNAISRLEGYKPNEKIEQVAGLLNSIYLSGAEDNPKNPNLQIVGERIRVTSITPYPDFAFQQIQSNSKLIENFVAMVCQTDDHNQPIRHNHKYCLDQNKIKKIKDQYLAEFRCGAEQQNEEKNAKPQLDRFTVPTNGKENPRPKSPDRSAAKKTNETRLIPKR